LFTFIEGPSLVLSIKFSDFDFHNIMVYNRRSVHFIHLASYNLPAAEYSIEYDLFSKKLMIYAIAYVLFFARLPSVCVWFCVACARSANNNSNIRITL